MEMHLKISRGGKVWIELFCREAASWSVQIIWLLAVA